jgi:hypothetical protein
VFVGFVHLETATRAQDSWSADERDVVKVNDVEGAVPEYPADPRGMKHWRPELVIQQRRHPVEAAVQPMNLQSRRLLRGEWRITSMQEVVGVDVMQDGDVMPAPHERP